MNIPALRPYNSLASRLRKIWWEFLLKSNSLDLQSSECVYKELCHSARSNNSNNLFWNYKVVVLETERRILTLASAEEVYLTAISFLVLTEFSSLQHSQWHLWKAQFCHSVRKAWQEVWLLPVFLCKLHPKCVQLMLKQAEHWKETKTLRDLSRKSIIFSFSSH